MTSAAARFEFESSKASMMFSSDLDKPISTLDFLPVRGETKPSFKEDAPSQRLTRLMLRSLKWNL